jgi:type I restriction enzyme M protein
MTQLIDEGIIKTFDGHGSPESQNKGKGDLPYIRVKDIVNWNIYKDQTAFVPAELYKKYVKPQKYLKSEDILFVKRGSYRIGSVAMVSPFDQEMILTKEIQVFRIIKNNKYNISSFYLLYCLSSKIVQDQLFNKVLIETTLPNISDRWKDLKIPLFKENMLKDISERVDKIFTSQRWKSDESIMNLKNEYGNLIT